MLSRTADHLFWMSRYTERAENTARMLDVNYQTALLPQSTAVAQVGWEGLLSISELTTPYADKYGAIEPRKVLDFMVRGAQAQQRGLVQMSRHELHAHGHACFAQSGGQRQAGMAGTDHARDIQVQQVRSERHGCLGTVPEPRAEG